MALAMPYTFVRAIGILCLLTSSKGLTEKITFASIEKLSEQEVAKIVLPQIYQKLNISIDIIPLPANRAQKEANSGQKSGEILRIYSYGNETPNVIRVPTAYYSLTTAAFALKGHSILLNDLKGLSKYRIGRVRGVKHTNNATKGLARVYDSGTTIQLFKQLEQGNIDVALTNYLDGMLTIKRLKSDNYAIINKSLAYEPLYHYLHKEHQPLVYKIDREIKQLKQSGELKTMLEKAEKAIYQQML